MFGEKFARNCGDNRRRGEICEYCAMSQLGGCKAVNPFINVNWAVDSAVHFFEKIILKDSMKIET